MNYDRFVQNNRILMLALDHRGSIAKMLPAGTTEDRKKELIVSIKRMLLTSLAPYYSGVLFDSEYGLTAYRQSVSNPNVAKKPYMLCIEKTGYTDTDHERLTTLEYTVDELKKNGAEGVKLLLFFHPDGKTAAEQIALTRNVSEQCAAAGLPFFLEILNYSLNDVPYVQADLVPRSVNMFLDEKIHADVFKLEFPGTAETCKQVTEMLGATPWILLTKGDTYEGFVASLTVAAKNGARGFLAGRSIWQDFANLPAEKWPEFFSTVVVKRFKEISALAQ